MEKRIENYFPKILDKTELIFKEEIKKGGIPSAYRGYISEFGSMVIQNGILPALAYFEKEDNNAEGERKKIVDVMKEFLISEDIRFSKSSHRDKLVVIIKNMVKTNDSFNRDELRLIENKIIDISIALKLAMRTYLKVDNKEAD